jgi:hypothetical protein
MRKIAIAAAMIAVGFGFWVASPSNARAPALSQRVDPHQMMMNASAMPTTEFIDYSFVFVH